MPLATFNPPMRPSAGTTHTPKVSLYETSFGDGYEQRIPQGLNHIRDSISLKWDYLTLVQARTIVTFLKGQGGYMPFYYTLNGETLPRKWTCSEWSMTDNWPCKVSITLRESFTTDT